MKKKSEHSDVASRNISDGQVNVKEGDLFQDDMSVDGDDGESHPLAALLASAEARATQYNDDNGLEDYDSVESDEEDDDGEQGVVIDGTAAAPVDFKNPDSSRRSFDKVFKQVLEAADVILYVLDARDPEGTRSKEVERQIMAAKSGSKRLILVLNKIDLVPPNVLKAWLLHLRRYFPTIPLQASTPASNAQTFNHRRLTVRDTSETMLRALKSYAASKQLRRSISVGVIGYPNVGKSSVINALTSKMMKGTQSPPCPVGSEAGVTRALREVKIDNKLKMLDSPGIVFPSPSAQQSIHGGSKGKVYDEAHLILLSAFPFKQIWDPVPAVSLLLSRLSASPLLGERLLQTYGITALGPFAKADTTMDFLVQVARKRGRLGKGGVPNVNAAAMTVITDWRDGRIQGWVEAPVLQIVADSEKGAIATGVPGSDRKKVVKDWSAEFKLEGLWGDGDREEDMMNE